MTTWRDITFQMCPNCGGHDKTKGMTAGIRQTRYNDGRIKHAPCARCGFVVHEDFDFLAIADAMVALHKIGEER